MATNGDIDSVNHIGVAVRDMDRGVTRYEKLGFTLSPLSVHSGSLKPGEPVQPMATGNRCAIFEHNYVEILGIVNPDLPSWGWAKFVEKFEGAHIICLGCGDAETVDRRVSGNGIKTSGVIKLQRDVETAEGMKTARFDCTHFDSSITPEGLIQAAHHRTPEYIHQERYLTHENGAQCLDEVVLVTMDPAAESEKYERLTGVAAQRKGHRREIVLSLVSRLVFIGPEMAGEEFRGSLVAPVPAIAAMSFPVSDLDKTEELLKSRGLTTVRQDNQVLVPAEQALGVVHVFTQA